MRKNKKLITLFSFILSFILIFSNTVGVYCADPDGSTKNDFNYNIYNPNLIPFYTNERGIGWYYTGAYCPEIIIDDDCMPSDLNYGDVDYLYQLLGIGNINTYNLNLKIAFNPLKTHLYYWDGAKLTMYPNGSMLKETKLASNFSMDLNKFFYNLDGSKSGYDNIKNDIVYNGWDFTNYFMSSSKSGDRTYMGKYSNCSLGFPFSALRTLKSIGLNNLGIGIEKIIGYYPSYFNDDGSLDLKYYANNSYHGYPAIINDLQYFDDGGMSLKKLNVNYFTNDDNADYSDEDGLHFYWFNTTQNPEISVNDDVYKEFWIDYYNTLDSTYERVYIQYPILKMDSDVTKYESDDSNLYISIKKLKSYSSFAKAGSINHIQIKGVGVCFVDTNDYLTEINWRNRSSLYTYSNSMYCAFVYEQENNNYLAGKLRIYELMTDCSSATLIQDIQPRNEYGEPIVDGIDPDYGSNGGGENGSGNDNNDDDNNNNNPSGGFIDWINDLNPAGFLSYLGTLFTGVFGLVNFLPTFLNVIFGSFLPPEIINLISFSIAFIVILGIIKVLRG